MNRDRQRPPLAEDEAVAAGKSAEAARDLAKLDYDESEVRAPITGRISQAKNRMEGPDSLRGAWNLRDEQIAKIYEKYLSALKECNALDFDDLLLKTVELFETSAQIRERYGRRAAVGGQPRQPGRGHCGRNQQ